MSVRIQVADHPELETLVTTVERRITAAINRVEKQLRAHLGLSAVRAAAQPSEISPDDAAVVQGMWQLEVDEQLLAAIGAIVAGASTAVIAALIADLPAGTTIPGVPQQWVDAYLAGTRNRLVGIGDDLWNEIRDTLAAGIALGDSIPDLADRITVAAGLVVPRTRVIARTETISAVNAGSYAQVRMSSYPAVKTWLATNDARTREAHVAADGQAVAVNEPFMVDGEALQFPGDPAGSAHNTIQCRCTATFEVDTSAPPGGALTAAAGENTGAMIALIPSEADLDRLAITGGEPREILHLTLWFLGEAADWDDDQRAAMVEHVRTAADGFGTVSGNGFGVNLWNVGTDSPSWNLAVTDVDDGEDLETVRNQVSPYRLSDPSAEVGAVSIPEQHSPWVPHVCLAYSDDPDYLAELEHKVGPITFDRLRVVFGGDATDVTLGADMTATTTEPVTAAAVDGDCPEGQHPDPDGACVPDEDTTENVANWVGPMVVEGVPTGDGRQFAEGATTWPDPAETPMALQWQKETNHGGLTDLVVSVGRITEIWRDGAKIMGRGTIDLGSEDGAELARRMAGGPVGVSIVGDDPEDPAGLDVEYVYPEECGETSVEAGEEEIIVEEDTPMECFIPELMIFHSNRIRALTVVDTPAFVEAMIELEDAALAAALTAGAVGTHETATSDATWDGPANEARLPSPLTEAKARAAYAWIDETEVEDGELPKSAAKFIHHEVDTDGNVGAANTTACSTGIGVLHGGRGGTTIPGDDEQGVYNHLASHMRDAGLEPPEFAVKPATLLAAAVAHLNAARPPADWFSDPLLAGPTPVTIEDDGRIFGHMALWGTCHTGFSGKCVTPPREDNYAWYTTGEMLCSDGSRVPVGQITLGTGHAPLNLGASGAVEHYDNTGTAVADVTAGSDPHGIWVAGKIRAGVAPSALEALRASALSGDWRRIAGRLRMVALLAVNVPGYPIPRMRSRVASGEQVALVAAGMLPTDPLELAQRGVDLVILRDRLARSAGVDLASRRAELLAQIG